MFSSNIRIIYLYIVSFLSLMAIVFGFVTLVEKVTNYVYPVYYVYNYEYPEVYEDEIYTRETKIPKVDENIEKENARIRTIREIVTSIAVIVISLPLYMFHWFVIQKERKKDEV